MCDDIGFIQRQSRAEKAQSFKIAKFAKRFLSATVNGKRERWLVSEQTEKDQVVLVDVVFNLVARKQDRMRWFATNETAVAPYRNETSFFADNCVGKPGRIFTAVTAAIDKRSCEYVVIFQVL